MNGETPNPLDRLLQQWADARTADDAQLNRLKQQIIANLEHEASGTGVADDGSEADRLKRIRKVGSTGRGVWTFALRVAAGVAAGVLVMVGALWLWQSELGHHEPLAPPSELPPAYAWLQETQLREKAVLLQEMESIFDRQTIWLAETGKNIDMGVVNRTTLTEMKPVAVRVVVERRRVAESAWTSVWAVDVMTRSEEVVRLTSKSAKAAQLVLWSYVLPDGMIAVDCSLTLGESAGVPIVTSGLQSDCQPVEVYSAIVDGDEIRVFQTAAVLSDSVS